MFEPNPIVQWIINVSERGLEYAARRYYGLYGAVVESNDDPRSQGRVSARIGVLGIGTADRAVHSKMLKPMSIYAGEEHGLYFPPEDGDMVYVSFDHGDPQAPRFHGSWWGNLDSSLTASGSQVPTEFKVSGPPTKRGIKTKFGHGLVFSDDPQDPFVQLWSGKQDGAQGTEATKQQRVTLANEGATTKNQGVYVDTFYGHKVHLDDVEKTVLISGLSADPAGEVANSIKIDDTAQKVTIKTSNPVPQTIVLDGTTGNIDIISPAIINVTALGAMNLTATGAITMAAAGGIATGSGAVPPAPAIPGASVETGVGTKLINFAGVVTETLAGFIQNVATSISITTPIFTINAPVAVIGPPGIGITLLGGLVTIGNPGTAQQVTNAQLIEFLKSHTHIGNLGAPTPLSPASTLLLQDPSNPALPNPLYVTQTKMI